MITNSYGGSFQSDENILQLKIYTQLCEYTKKKKKPTELHTFKTRIYDL